MPRHNYTPQRALQLLLDKLEDFPEMGAQVRNAIAQGKEIEVLDESQSVRKTKKARSRREKLRLSEEEALLVALRVLHAYFLEIPLFANTANKEFAAFRSFDQKAEVQIEQVPVTAFNLEEEPEMMTLQLVSEAEIEQQTAKLRRLEELFRFQEEGI